MAHKNAPRPIPAVILASPEMSPPQLVVMILVALACLCVARGLSGRPRALPASTLLEQSASRSLSPEGDPAPGEVRLESDLYGPYSVVMTPAGPSGPIFHSRLGYGLWELDGRPPLDGMRRKDRTLSFGG
jgi:hypothetical protein